MVMMMRSAVSTQYRRVTDSLAEKRKGILRIVHAMHAHRAAKTEMKRLPQITRIGHEKNYTSEKGVLASGLHSGSALN